MTNLTRNAVWRWPPHGSRLVLAVFLFVGLCAGSNLAEEKPETTPPQKKAKFYNRLRVEYDYRTQGDDSDNDLYGYWYSSGKDLGHGYLDFYTSGKVQTDLDDPPSSNAQSDDPYISVSDQGGVTEERVMQLYGDLHDRERKIALRAGRQYIDIADYLQVDGAQVTVLENERVGGRIYAGQPVSYYSSVSGDLAAGMSVLAKLAEGNRTRLTFARYYDDEQDDSDHNYFADVYQQISDISRVRLQLSVLNEDFRTVRGDFFLFSPDGKTDLFLGASRWGSFDAQTRAYSPLYDVLGEQEPYTYGYVRLTQELVPHWLISPGASIRLAESGSDDYSNRDYRDYDVTLIYEPNRAFSSSVSVQYWNIEDDDSFLGLSGEMRYRHLKLWELSGGAHYADYTYSQYSDISYATSGGTTTIYEDGTVVEESPYVYTYFVRGKWNVNKKLALRLQGEMEDHSDYGDNAYRVRGSAEVKF